MDYIPLLLHARRMSELHEEARRSALAGQARQPHRWRLRGTGLANGRARGAALLPEDDAGLAARD
jgi:hypothetical protein